MARIVKVIAAVLLVFLAGTASGEEKFDYGKQWTDAEIGQKMFFVEGYQTGYIIGVMNATKNFMPAKTEKEKEEAFKRASMIYSGRRFGKDMLVSILLIMNKLYEDPRNRFIEKGFIYELAVDSIRGRDISEDLVLHRKSAEEG